MKPIILVFSLLSIFILGCNSKKKSIDYFSSSSDTLVLSTKKIKGFGLFPAGAGSLHFFDSTQNHGIPIVFPNNITNIKIAFHYVDSKPFLFEYFNKERPDELKEFLAKNYPTKIDTSKLPSYADNTICIISGVKDNDKIFIVDENNNKDFSDDSIRLYHRMDWNRTSGLIKCKYKVFNGKHLVEDSTWVNIGTFGDNELYFFVSHHLESRFNIGHHEYIIGVHDNQSNFLFDEPIIALLSQNGIRKDTLLESELLYKDEYLKLGDAYYRFFNITNDGKLITLIKEEDFKNKIGTQVGLIAPNFDCKTINGDSVHLESYKGKYLLLINLSSCYSKISSYECYKELTESYKGELVFLGIDNSPVFLRKNIKELKLKGVFIIADENPMMKPYRPNFSSRTCLLINPEGHIIDKFEIFDWKTNLKQFEEQRKYRVGKGEFTR